MMDHPLTFNWDGEAMVPLPRFARECGRCFVPGECYPLEVREGRSSATHRHFFAAVHDAWLNLPEAIAAEYPTSEHLRKRALIATGHCDTRDHVCASVMEARALAAFIRPIDTYALVECSGPVVRIHIAKSQSTRAMNKATFQASKTAVLDYIADLVGITAAELTANAGRAA
jgi:hypothetical protein